MIKSINIRGEWRNHRSLPEFRITCPCGYEDKAGQGLTEYARRAEAEQRALAHNTRHHGGSYFIHHEKPISTRDIK